MQGVGLHRQSFLLSGRAGKSLGGPVSHPQLPVLLSTGSQMARSPRGLSVWLGLTFSILCPVLGETGMSAEYTEGVEPLGEKIRQY